MYQVRFGVALVGCAGAGKSVLRRLLAEGSTWLRDEELSQVSHVTMELICTGCTVVHRCAMSLLYVCSGAFALLSHFGEYFACAGNYWLYAAKAGVYVLMLYQVSRNLSVFNSSASYIDC